MTVLDLLLGDQPKPYNWRDDPRARPSAEERQNLATHVDQCTIRQIEIKQMFAQTRIERYHDRKVLFLIAAMVAASAGGVPQIIAAFLP